jgi:hypothetical protein
MRANASECISLGFEIVTSGAQLDDATDFVRADALSSEVSIME